MPAPRRQEPGGLPPEHERRTRDDRRRTSWQEFRHAYPGVLVTMAIALLIVLVADGWLIYKRQAYAGEITRLRGDMTDVERERADLILASDERRFQMMVELIRRQAQADDRLHLALALDSATMTLQREGAVLRAMAVEVGPERVVGVSPDTVRLAAPRGKRTVERVLDADEPWEVPAWVYGDRGLPAPADRALAGALGPHALILNGGTVVYSAPSAGPLAGAGYVLPGSIRVAAADLAAIAPNVAPGMAIYFY